MKKLFVLLVFAIFSLGIVAQENKMQNHIMMKNGKMMMVKEGKMMMMYKEMTLENGATVSSKGIVKMKNGKTMIMKNGDMIDMNGKIMVKKMKDHVVMREGKMMVLKNGKMMLLTKNMTMADGSIVFSNGLVKRKDGKTIMMKNGDMMYMNGIMKKSKMKKNRNDLKLEK
ncbi:MAG: DUF6799 domain-containing protein [Flavobacterium sp.]